MAMRTLSILILLGLLSPIARAGDEHMVIDVKTKTKSGLYPIAVPLSTDSDPTLAKLVAEVQSFDLAVASWFQLLDPTSFLADLRAEGLSIEPQRWKDVGAFGVVKSRATTTGGKVFLQFKLYELEKGAEPVLEKQYEGPASEARKLVHRWSDEVVRHFTGEPGFFDSDIVFVTNRKGKKEIVVMDFDGEGVHAISHNDSVNILPAWSPSGGEIAYTSYMRANPDLYVGTASGGRPKRVAHYPGMNTGASFSPDGKKIAVTLSRDGNSEIYVLNAGDGTIAARLTNNRYIDTSPAWSPDGSEIAFVSNREGGPQIFVMTADGANQRRVSTVGNHNQTPAWCPRKGVRILAYTARDDVSSRFDVVTLDLASGKMTRITQGQGDNEEPTWAPNGWVLAFASRRADGSGIYLANANGQGEQRLVHRGSVTSPDWGPRH